MATVPPPPRSPSVPTQAIRFNGHGDPDPPGPAQEVANASSYYDDREDWMLGGWKNAVGSTIIVFIYLTFHILYNMYTGSGKMSLMDATN